MKIVILDGYTENPGDLSWKALNTFGEVETYDRTPADEAVIQQRIAQAEIVITNKTPLSQKTIMASEKLQFISVLATGYNVVDVAAAKEKGIPVSNVPTYGTAAVAQYTMALLLEICHHVALHDQAVHQGKWERCIDWCFWEKPLIELAGKKLGVIGFGRIGQAVARIAKAMGMTVVAYDKVPNESGRQLAEYVSLDELLTGADVISLHCPLLPENTGMINRKTIEKMKDGVIILNTARGPLIQEQDLADALCGGKVYAAAMDVVSTEPIKGDNPLLHAPNCIITPHIAWAPKESRQRIMDTTAQNIQAFLSHKPIHVVND